MTKCLRLLGLCVTVLAAAVPARAQDTPKVEVSGGYQFIRFDGNNRPKGWYADLAGNVTRALGIVGEVGGNYRSVSESGITINGRIHEFMAGVRASARKNPHVVPFGQVLAGALHPSFSGRGATVTVSESETDFAFQLGGGVTVGLASKAGVRLGADYLRVSSDRNTTNIFRFAAGINLGLP